MDEAPTDAKGERVAKILARAGLCSRRDAERWIAEGRVALRGEKLTSPAVNVVDPAELTVDGKPLPAAERARLWRYHKPAGLVTTHRDEKGRETVFEKLPPGTPRLISVGRLDLNSEGLLLLTNDGELARRLELPANGWLRRYKVRVHGVVDAKRLEALEQGIMVDGVAYGPIHATFEGEQRVSNIWLTVSLREGRNREIRKVMQHLGLAVTRLIRLAYGPFQLGNLPRGALEEVPPKAMREQFGDDAKAGTAVKEPRPASKHFRPRLDKPTEGKRTRESQRIEGKHAEGKRAAGKRPEGKRAHQAKRGHADHRR
jgi:23S rRNA pseudouridine2605 synthase